MIEEIEIVMYIGFQEAEFIFDLGEANNFVYFCLWTITADICLRQIQYVLFTLASL